MVIRAQDVKLLREKTGAGIMDCKKALADAEGDFEKAVKLLRERGIAELKKRSGREAKDGLITVLYSEDRKEVVMVEVNCETDFVSRTDKYRDFVQEIASSVLEKRVEDPRKLPEEITQKVNEAVGLFGENILLRKIARFRKQDEKRSELYSYIHLGGRAGVIAEFLLADEEGAKHSLFQEFAKNITLQIASMGPISVSRDDLSPEILNEQREILGKQARESGKPEKIIEKIIAGKMDRFFADTCLLEQKYVKDADMSIGDYLKNVQNEIGGNIEIKRFARFKLGED